MGGDFQIVQNNSNNNNLINNSISLSKISGLIGADFNSNTSLTTEVGILKSTSILVPVYEYVKNEKQKKYPKRV